MYTEYQKKYYEKNKGKHIAYTKKWRTRNLEKMTKYYNKVKDYRNYTKSLLARFKVIKGCVECGYNKCSFALHFDHIDKTDKHNLNHNRAIEPRWSITRIKKELSKCQILCATCHAEKTVINNDNHTIMNNIKWRK